MDLINHATRRMQVFARVANKLGDVAVARYRFQRAFFWYSKAGEWEGDTDEKAFLIMKAARSLQMAENWRSQSASWEWLGNSLGMSLDASLDPTILLNRYGVPEGRETASRFFVISDAEWRLRPGANEEWMQRVQQAWSYDWAAGQAEAESRHEESARLARRAGVCWEKTQLPHRLSRAATCYYRAAIEASQSAQLSTRRKIFEAWCPSCLRDLSRTEQCLEHESGTSPEDIAASDVERIVRCWRTLRDERGMLESDDLFEEQDRELSGIQRRLAAVGERGEAKRLYRFRQKCNREYFRQQKRVRYVVALAGWIASKNGSGVGRLVLSLTVLYAVVLPTVWLVLGGVPHTAGLQPHLGILSALLFSLSTTVNLSTGYFAPGGWVSNLFQAIQGISAYFALGYILWVAQRSYEG